MNEQTPLERLCSLYGIQGNYVDVWGTHHEVPMATRLALLSAMGLPVESEAAIQEASRQQGNQEWRRLVPAVLVVSDHAFPMTIPLTLPEARRDTRLAWRLLLETGEERAGAVCPSRLRLLERQTIDGVLMERRAFVLESPLPCGYHRLECAGRNAHLSLIITPRRCYLPDLLAGADRIWGPAAQLYSLRSRHNWGIGDFSDLRRLVEAGTRGGAALVGLNPLHDLFAHEPERASPYSPSSRLFLNALAIDVEAVPDLAECDQARSLVASNSFQSRLHALRETEMVDYTGVASAKHRVLELLWQHFRDHHLTVNSARGRGYRLFEERRGKALRRHTIYQALQETLYSRDPKLWGWKVWPAAYRDPDSAEVARFAREQRDRVGYYLYLQWEADRQLGLATECPDFSKRGVGLYRDLAIAGDLAGSEAWSNQTLYACHASIGAPPDDFSPLGQDWGLPPWKPQALRESRYEPFIAILRANMMHARALRIDHVMGLMRLYWIPRGMPAKQGAYVHYPVEDLLGILALESQRNRCLVIGEDLGTVPEELRATLQATGVLSYRLLLFERRSDGSFSPPSAYPRQALAAVSTHDLPTLRGFWQGRDIEERARLGLFQSRGEHLERAARRTVDRARLLVALDREGLLPPDSARESDRLPELDERHRRAVHTYLARTPSRIMMVQLDDLLGELDQVNMPGTTTERPNWRRKLGPKMEDWIEGPEWHRLSELMRRERDK